MKYTMAIVGLMALTGCLEEEADLDPVRVAHGEEVFSTCTACHSIQARSNQVGPHLVDLIDRPAGTVEGYAYSEAMMQSGLVWTPDQLKAFLLDPLGTVPGTKMALGEISDEDAGDVVVYIQSLQ